MILNTPDFTSLCLGFLISKWWNLGWISKMVFGVLFYFENPLNLSHLFLLITFYPAIQKMKVKFEMRWNYLTKCRKLKSIDEFFKPKKKLLLRITRVDHCILWHVEHYFFLHLIPWEVSWKSPNYFITILKMPLFSHVPVSEWFALYDHCFLGT